MSSSAVFTRAVVVSSSRRPPEAFGLVRHLEIVDQPLDPFDDLDMRLRAALEFLAAHLPAQQHDAVVDDDHHIVVVVNEILVAIDRIERRKLDVAVATT
jgi:hypothetical protein